MTPSGPRLTLVDTSTFPTLWSPCCCQSPSSCTSHATSRSRTASKQLSLLQSSLCSKSLEPFLKAAHIATKKEAAHMVNSEVFAFFCQTSVVSNG